MRYRRWTPAVLALPALLLAACGSSTTPSSAGGNNYGSSMSTKSSTSGMTGKSTGKSKSGSSGMMSSSTASLMKVKTHLGAVLADSKGLTLYWYSKDTSMTSACTGGCATAWPPLTGKPMAAMGVRLTGKLGTITRSGGIVQATYKGHPLYLFKFDHASGQVTGQRQNFFGGKWYAVSASGAANTKAPPGGGGATTSTTTTGTTCGIYGCG